jgi:hypothetical protein
MTTLRRAKLPVLVGRLSIHGPVGQPHLEVTVWCPYCRRHHCHGWDRPPFRVDTISHRGAHCADGPLVDGGYFVGLDPAAKDANRAVVREYERQLRALDEMPRGRGVRT